MYERVRIAIVARSAIFCVGLGTVLQTVDRDLAVVGATTLPHRLAAILCEHDADLGVLVRPSEYPRGALESLPRGVPFLVLGDGARDIAAVGERPITFARIDDPAVEIAARVRSLVAEAPTRRLGRSASRIVAGVRVTARERDLAHLIAQGLSNAHIARTLGVAQQTVKNQLSAFMAKTGTESRLQLCRWVMQHGIVGDVPGSHVVTVVEESADPSIKAG